MPIPERSQTASSDPRFRILQTDDGSRTLVDVATGDTFHSGCGAAAECRYVYLENSGSGARLRSHQPTSVLEVGFGTGMAFVLTAAEALRGGAPLDYMALERRLLPAAVIEQILADPPNSVPPSNASQAPNWASEAGAFRASLSRPEYARVRAGLLAQLAALPAGASGDQHLQLSADCRLGLVLGDAAEWQPSGEERFDAIYFDPFSPASNPQLWEPEVLRRMRTALAPEGRLVSYCVNRVVRDRLASVGFRVRRVPGPPGGKREVLIAEGA